MTREVIFSESLKWQCWKIDRYGGGLYSNRGYGLLYEQLYDDVPLKSYFSNHNICLLVRTLQQIYVMSVSFCTIDQTSQRFLTTMAQTAIFHPQILSPEFLWAKIIIGSKECLLMTLQFNHLCFFSSDCYV